MEEQRQVFMKAIEIYEDYFNTYWFSAADEGNTPELNKHESDI